MKFTVKAKTTSNVTIEYEDKSIAVIPIVKGFTKDNIKYHAALYNERVSEFDSADDVPVTVGEVLETTVELDKDATYKEAREAHYPSVAKQLDVAYWARNGDDAQQKKVDEAIKLVKDTIPKTWTGKQSQIASLMD